MGRSMGVVVGQREAGGFERYLGGKSTEVVYQVQQMVVGGWWRRGWEMGVEGEREGMGILFREREYRVQKAKATFARRKMSSFLLLVCKEQLAGSDKLHLPRFSQEEMLTKFWGKGFSLHWFLPESILTICGSYGLMTCWRSICTHTFTFVFEERR